MRWRLEPLANTTSSTSWTTSPISSTPTLTLRIRAGLPKLTLDGACHEHATLMICSGADIALVSKRLGHASVAITSDIYSHLIGSASRDAANRTASLVPRKKGGAHTLHAQHPENAEDAAPALRRNCL